MSTISCSVALCTYNGSRYIEGQLRSIIDQTVPVNEIVICDDRSSDDTIAIIERIKRETDVPIRIYINETNLGVCGNFDRAIRLCKEDIIFLSDQDDIWHPDKVETILLWFEMNPYKNVVFTNASFIDAEGNPYAVGSSLFKCVGLTQAAKKLFDRGFAFELFLKGNRATGATMAIRRTFVNAMYIDNTATMSNGKPLHDCLISLSAIEHDSLGYLDMPLIQYRIYSGQVCGLGSLMNKPLLSDVVSNRYYGQSNSVEYLTQSEYINRWNFLSTRQTRRFVKPDYLWLCIKDIPKYLHYYRWYGVLMFLNDVTLPIRCLFK